MSKIESIIIDDKTETKIKYKLPYTSSIFIFDKNGLISANSKYFTDSLTLNNYKEYGLDEEMTVGDLPITVTYRTVPFYFGEEYLAIIDGVPYGFHCMKAQNLGLIIREKPEIIDIGYTDEKVKRFYNFLDNEELDNRNYLYVRQRLKKLNKPFSNKNISGEDFTSDLVSKDSCFFITCTGKHIKCIRVKSQSNNNDFSFQEVRVPPVDYNELFDYLEEIDFGRKKEPENNYHI